MASNVARRPSRVIGENIHATRTVSATGNTCVETRGARVGGLPADVAGMLRTSRSPPHRRGL